MVAYSFKPQFAIAIVEGTKGGTIRGERAGHGHAHPGQQLQLYTGMRTRYCKLVAERICIATTRITLSFGLFNIEHVKLKDSRMFLSAAELDAFAVFDGFEDWSALKRFWHDEHDEEDSFHGWHIRWKELPEALR